MGVLVLGMKGRNHGLSISLAMIVSEASKDMTWLAIKGRHDGLSISLFCDAPRMSISAAEVDSICIFPRFSFFFDVQRKVLLCGCTPTTLEKCNNSVVTQ